jgi:hypothetical protein
VASAVSIVPYIGDKDVSGADFSEARIGSALVYNLHGFSTAIGSIGFGELDFSESGDGSDIRSPEYLLK